MPNKVQLSLISVIYSYALAAFCMVVILVCKEQFDSFFAGFAALGAFISAAVLHISTKLNKGDFK